MNKKIPVSFRSQGKKINIKINFVLKDLFENLSLDVELINETQVVEIQQDQILLSEFCYKIPEFLWSLDDWILIYKDSGGVESICVGDYMIWAHVRGRSNHLDHLLKNKRYFMLCKISSIDCDNGINKKDKIKLNNWKTIINFNRVQEKVLGGSYSYGRKQRKARSVTSFQKDIELNEQLFELAGSYLTA
jgi:hypothetical protein